MLTVNGPTVSRVEGHLPGELQRRLIELCCNATSVFVNAFELRSSAPTTLQEKACVPVRVTRLGLDPTLIMDNFDVETLSAPVFGAFKNITYLHLFLAHNYTTSHLQSWQWTGLRGMTSLKYLVLDVHDVVPRGNWDPIYSITANFPSSLKLCVTLTGKPVVHLHIPAPSHPAFAYGVCGGYRSRPLPTDLASRVLYWWFDGCHNRDIERQWNQDGIPLWLAGFAEHMQWKRSQS